MEKLRLALAGAWHVHTRWFLEQVNRQFGEKIEWACVWDHDEARGRAMRKS